MSRWVRVQANFLNHHLFANLERSESDAWLWLIANAAWSPTSHRIGHDVVSVPVGSLFVTLRHLQKEWNWKSDKRVRSFLKMLENEEMIVINTNAGKTQITICNYSKYQDVERSEDASGTQSGRTKDTNTPNTSSLRSDVKARAPRQSQKDFVSELSGLLDAETIEAIVDHRKKKRAPITARAGMLMAKELRKCPCPQEAADMMLLHGWQGIKAEWVQNRQPQKRKEPPPRQRNIGDAIRDEARRLGVLTDEPDHPDTRLQQNSHTAGNVTVLDLAFKPAFKSFG